jgi:hypothetical protein
VNCHTFFKHHKVLFAKIFLNIFVVAILFLKPNLAYSEPLFYKIEDNDHLMLILRTFHQSLYLGEDNAIPYLIKKNSFLQKRKKSDLVRPGDKIYFDEVSAEQIIATIPYRFTSITEDGRVRFICSKENLENWIHFKKENFLDFDPLDSKYRTLAHRCSAELTDTNEISIRAPASENTAAKVLEPKNGFSSFEIGTEFIYSSLETKHQITNSSAKLVSLWDQGIYLKWNQHWNESFSSHFKAGFQTVTITEANEVSIEDRKQKKGTMELGISLLQNESQIDFNLGYQDRPLQRYVLPLTVRLEIVPAPYAEIHFKKILTKGRPLMMGLSAGAGAVLPYAAGIYKDDGSFYYQGGLIIGHQESKASLLGTFQYKTNTFNSNQNLKNQYNEFKMDISYRWLWGL